MLLEELPYWLALWRIKGIGPAHFRLLTDQFSSMLECFSQPAEVLGTLGLSPSQCQQIRRFQLGSARSLLEGVNADLEWQEQSPSHHILTWASDDYPSLLREISGSPPVLFIKGDPVCLSLPQIAIVGSRHCSRRGKQTAMDFSRAFAEQGFSITSGLALGIDTAAHSGALQGGGTTVAVLAHGLDTLYPARNRTLAQDIELHGALVSEFPLGVQPRPEYFPRRNRIVSGLSLGVLVVEAALKSGSLITAHEAVDQGREVFAMPGSVHDPLVKGCHALIRNGARLVETAEQVVEEMRPLLGFVQQQAQLELAMPAPGIGSGRDSLQQKYGQDSAEARLLNALCDDCTSVDQLVGLTGLSVADVSSTLVMLELDGVVIQERGGYCRI